MSNQLELITEEAINRVATAATSAWMDEARMAVKVLCARNAPFTTDDVWRLMTLVHTDTRDHRALGAVMRQAVKDGLIRNTGRYRKSTRPECHRRPIAIWQPVRITTALTRELGEKQ